MSTKPYYHGLDLVRSLAALAVAFGHVRNLLLVDYTPGEGSSLLVQLVYFLSGFGHQAVVYFFVLSGCVIGSSILSGQATARWSWSHYLIARLTRLLIVVAPALVLTAAFDLAGKGMQPPLGVYHTPEFGHVITEAFPANLTVPVFLGNLLFVQAIHVPVFGTNAPLWSLSYEFWYYLLFPLLLGVCLAGRSTVQRILMLLLALGVAVFVGPTVMYYFLIWLLGVVIIVFRGKMRFAGQPAYITALVVAVLLNAALLVAIRFRLISHTPYAQDMLLALAAGPLLWLLTNAPAHWFAGMTGRISHWLSSFSFTLYACHLPLAVFIVAVLLGGSARLQPTPVNLGLFCLVILAVIILCRGLYLLTEARTEKLRLQVSLLFGLGAGRVK